VVLTSATVPAGIVEQLHLPPEQTTELDVGTPFDFAHQSLLYCAASLPDPRSEDFPARMLEELGRLIRLAGGRTLALFTSHRMLQRAADEVGKELPYQVLVQGQRPKNQLVEAFATDETSCLFATMGYWQGIDVPGPALSLVTLDRIPFPRPDEPLSQARRDAAGPRAFQAIDVPRAATLLAQGAGRLIRSRTDRGVVAVLDPRLANAKSYRWLLVQALPPMPRTKDLADVEAFFAGEAPGKAQ
jgi:ATP-dependent DNA helicase DinG